MGPKTSGNTGADFQKKVDKMFELEEQEQPPLEKEDEEPGDKSSEGE